MEMTRPEAKQPVKWEWLLYMDKSSNNKGSETRVIHEGPDDIMFKFSLKFDFNATNNQVKYEALVVRLQLVKEVRAWMLDIRNDSQLVMA